MAPFRWDLGRREQLGSLIIGESASFPEHLFSELRLTAAKIIARSSDTDVVFIGRSPENIFDYLSGIFSFLQRPPSLTLQQLSSWDLPELTLPKLEPLLEYFRSERLDPHSLASFGKAVRFVDVVDTGHTFSWLAQTIQTWSDHERADWNVVKGRIGFLGLTKREKTSPNTYRWQQQDEWLKYRGQITAKNISVSPEFWCYIGNTDLKVTPPYHLDRWGTAQASMPPRTQEAMKALRGAIELYDLGCDRAERLRFAHALTEQSEMSEPWLRRLVMDLRARRKN